MMETPMKKSDYWFDLPQELIAQTPVEPRDHSRLFLLSRQDGSTGEAHFYDLPDLLQPGDLLVMNDSRVLPARLYGEKENSGGAIEFLLLEQKQKDQWEILVKPGRRAKPGARFTFGGGLLTAEVLETLESGNRLVRFFYEGNFYSLLEQIGQMPLPHYITKELEDRERYQTVYSRELGSAAAPTAGLHFTNELLEKLRGKGIQTAFVTLHVGLGTFRPVKEDVITRHHMHSEHYHLSQETADLINRTKQAGHRVIGVGTTSCRTLESVAALLKEREPIREADGYTNIFIYPGFQFRVLDGLITNFHLPESTLIMLVSAFAGYENTMRAYREAIEKRFRFYSFGDAMYIG